MTAASTRIAIVGAGNVGSTFAYTLLLSGLAPEIVLIDVDGRRAEGEAMDLGHAVPFSRPTRVWAGDYADCSGAAVTVITAGSGQRPGETRLDLVRRNATIFDEIAPRVAEANPDGIVLVTTNPVDVLTYTTLARTGLPRERVIGSGTTLDTGRFRALLAEHFAVDARSVHAFIVGEHGDSEVPVWSLANVAGMSLAELTRARGQAFDQAELDEIFERTRRAAYEIIERKGATYYAIAAALLRIVEAIVRAQRPVLSVSSLVDGPYGLHDVCLSLPTVVGRAGAERILELPLDGVERDRLHASARVLRDTIDSVADQRARDAAASRA